VHDSELLRYLLIAIKDFNPDIIEVFGTENEFGMICTQVNKPVVIHFQGSIKTVSAKWFTGITRWEQLKSRTIRQMLNKSGVYKEFVSFKLRGSREEMIMQSCNFFIGRTEFDRRLISLISPQAKYFFCEEFIRKDFFKNQWNVPLSGAIKCISILKGVTYKGIDLIFETVKVLRQYGLTNIDFKICGVSENEEVVRILRNRYKNDDCIKSVKFIGKVDTKVLIHELTSSNFFIHPSYMENSSNSICEAMALGMPVIATNVGGTSSLIENGVNGLLVQEGEPLSMAASIIGLIKEYQKAIDLGINAREKAIIRHGTELLTKRTLEIYKGIIDLSNKEN
jgi:glycosyltransferase involved in cell wall biosynthesis